ncbi:MAG: acyl-CoA synthetase [Oceanicaulis sp.]
MSERFGAFRGLQDVEAVERVALAARLAAPTVFGCIKAACEAFPDRTAIIDLAEPAKARRWTYEALHADIVRCANALHAAGAGRPAGYLLPNLAETHIVLWGAAAGVGAAPVNPLLSADIVSEILREAGAGVLVTTPPGTPLHAVAEAVSARLDGMEILTVGEGGSLSAAMAGQPGDRFIFEDADDPERVAAYFHTGGTTGAPKLAQQTRANQAAMQWMLRYCVDLSETDVFLTGLPLFHANAAILSGLAPLCAGSALLLAGPDGFRNKALIANFWRIVETHGVTAFSAVPTIYSSLLDVPVAGAEVSSLRYGFCGAAPMPVSVIERFEARTGVTLIEGYGMTESTCVSTANPRDGEKRAGSIGVRLPYHEVKIAVLDEDGAFLRDAHTEEPGVVALRGPTVIPGYKQAERNAEAFLPGGWLNSGDLGRMDADGYVWLTGRAKDLIIRGGHNIDPGLIEEALARHADVDLAAAVGQPDAYAGEVPVAYVTLRAGAAMTAGELEAYARDTVSERPAAPKAVRILDAMPVTAVGKIFKPALREDAAVCAARAALEAAGLADLEISAMTDKRRGLVVRVGGLSHENAPAAAEALDPFSFAWERA